MKAPKIFAVVLVGHLLALSLLFVQQGCQTMTPEERADLTRPGDSGAGDLTRSDYEPRAESEPDPEEREREAPQRSEPMRPGGGGVAGIEPFESDPVDEPAVADDEGILSPLPDGEWDDWEEEEDDFGFDDEPVASRTYTVQRGDSIWNIAQRENVSMNDLLNANDLTRESIIQPGQELQIPESSGGGAGSANGGTDRPEPVDPPEGAQTYTVQRGDSLSVIAERYNTTVAELKSANNLSEENDTIRIGQELVLPEGGSALPSTGDSGPSVSSEPEELPDGIRHTVSSGESPGSIASRYGVSVDELMQANNISDPRRMRTGQVLVIPGTEGQGEDEADDGTGETESTEEETESSEDEPLQVVPDEPEEMEFIEDDEEEDDVPFVPIVPDDE